MRAVQRVRQEPQPEREQVADELLELSALIEPLAAPRTRAQLEQALDRLEHERVNLVVVGEFKRGKSTLINALLGRRLLPTGVVPLTSIVTLVRNGERERLIVRLLDGRELERPLDELRSFVTESENPGNEKGVDIVVAELPHPLLASGLQLVDTPGLGSVHAHNSEAARSFFPQIDAVLVVLSADQPLSQVELELVQDFVASIPKLFFCVNKLDLLDPEERRISMEFVRARLAEFFSEGEVELYGVSAREELGIEQLQRRLEHFLAGERRETLLASVASLGSAVAADTAQSLRFEAHALELPLEELEERLASFASSLAALAEAREEARMLLDRSVQQVVETRVDEPLLSYATNRASALESRLEECARERRGTSAVTEALDLEVATIVREEIERLALELEHAVAEGLEQAELRYASRMRNLATELVEAAAAAFGERPPLHLGALELSTPSRFSFKLRDEEQALEQLLELGQRLVPGALGRRVALRDAKRRLREMLDRHAGRLRSDLAQRVRASAAQYRRELEASLDEATAAIQAALARAEVDRRAGRSRIEERLSELAELAAELDRYAERLRQRYSRVGQLQLP
jgi:predicted GTPase